MRHLSAASVGDISVGPQMTRIALSIACESNLHRIFFFRNLRLQIMMGSGNVPLCHPTKKNSVDFGVRPAIDRPPLEGGLGCSVVSLGI